MPSLLVASGRVLSTDASAAKMRAGILSREDAVAISAELGRAGVALHVVVLAITHDLGLAARALPHLLPELLWVHELRQKAGLVSSRLRSQNLMASLVPSPDLLIVEQLTLTGCEMVVTCDLFATPPTEIDSTCAAFHLAATLNLLNGAAATWALLRGARQVAKSHQLSPGCFSISATPRSSRLQGRHAVISRCTARAWVVHVSASSAEDEAALATLSHAVFILDAWYALPITISIAPWTKHDILHPVQTLPQAQFLPSFELF